MSLQAEALAKLYENADDDTKLKLVEKILQDIHWEKFKSSNICAQKIKDEFFDRYVRCINNPPTRLPVHISANKIQYIERIRVLINITNDKRCISSLRTYIGYGHDDMIQDFIIYGGIHSDINHQKYYFKIDGDKIIISRRKYQGLTEFDFDRDVIQKDIKGEDILIGGRKWYWWMF